MELLRNCCFVGASVVIMLWTLLMIVTVSAVDDSDVDVDQCVVWGPGLNSDIVFPARYFMIQLVDKNGQNISESIGNKPFVVRFAHQGDTVRVWARTVDRRDGTYVVQYKLFESFSSLAISLTLGSNKRHVGASPYMLSKPVYTEKCYCPMPTLEEYTNTLACPSSYRQVTSDLKPFPKIDMTEARKEIVERFNQRGSHSLCHYVIKDNKIYRKTYGEHVGFKMFMDATLLSLTRKVRLPDVEFFVNLGDWPLEKRGPEDQPSPILSWCGSDETLDIVMPTYDVTESTLETMGRVTLDLMSVQGSTTPRWADKSPVAFWRGRDSRRERLNLVQMSKDNPDILDARMTNAFFFRDEINKDELVKHISFFDFFKHKYQLNIDGTVAAYRFPYLLGGDSLVLKQDSGYYEHFYKDLEPYVHYVPFQRDLSDLLQNLEWARENDQEAQKISANGRRYVQDNLMAGDIFCYHVVLFQEYAKRLVSSTEVLDDMELVDQVDHKCDCQRTTQTGKDEL